MVFRYVHRLFIDKIKAVVVHNGLVIYENLTIAQAMVGHPKDPDFLLKAGELAEYFSDYQILYCFEGTKTFDTGTNSQEIAQIVVRKSL